METLNSNKKEKELERRVTVRTIENGFIIQRTREYKDKKGHYQYETKEFYSKDDPFEDLEGEFLTDKFKTE